MLFGYLKELILYIDSLLKRIKELEKEVGALHERLNLNSQNSSKPPSTDMKKKRKSPSKKKRGAQMGHRGTFRRPVPEEDVDRKIVYKPSSCRSCGADLSGETDLSPRRHQVIDIPPIKPVITEFQSHGLTCPICGKHNREEIPKAQIQTSFGANIHALIAYFVVGCHMSKRQIRRFFHCVLSCNISLGAINACEERISKTLKGSVSEAHWFATNGEVLHADETGWKKAGEKEWLWVVVNSFVTVFSVFQSRSKASAENMLGDFSGVLITDRYNAYNGHKGYRQYCWAHLVRDFRRISERSYSKELGEALLSISHELFHHWHRFIYGQLNRENLNGEMSVLKEKFRKLLKDNQFHCDPKTKRFCEKMLAEEQNLWTFVTREGVEPTNNAAEQALRQAVIYRKLSFGTQSEKGDRYIERLLTCIESCRKQNRDILQFLSDSYIAYYYQTPKPSLLPL